MSGATRRFRRGETIAHRATDAAAGVVMAAVPQIVVADDPGLIVSFRPAGALARRRSGRRGGPRGRQLIEWDGGYEDLIWKGTNILLIHRPGDAYSVWSAWDREWRQMWWYINLEEPWRRTAIGFDSRDRELDLWARPGSDEWQWKDEDEFAWAIEQGRFTLDEARAIREDGERALATFRRADAPFDCDWGAWRPDPAWTLPVLPLDWNIFDAHPSSS